MDPTFIGPTQWDLIARALPNLVLFVAMMVNTTIPFLLGHAVLPSLETTSGSPGQFRGHRTVLYVVSAISLVLMSIALYRTVVLTAAMVREFFPRFAI
jgi:hypothetical protein